MIGLRTERQGNSDLPFGLPAADLVQGAGRREGTAADSARPEAFLGESYARGRSGPGVRVGAARAFEPGDDPEDLRALGAGDAARFQRDLRYGIGKQSAN